LNLSPSQCGDNYPQQKGQTMLEDLLRQMITALNANTEALGGKPSAAATAAAVAPPVAIKAGVVNVTAAPAKGKSLAADKPTMEMVKAALMAVKDAHGRPAAMKIVKEEGNATELPGIKPARFTAVLAKCAEVMGAPEEAEEDEGEEAEEDDL
jgi:hypothetical protein